MSTAPPTLIAEYEVIAPLGQGASGVAYQARSASGQEVAVKLLSDACASEPEMQQRFVREASVLQKLNHPGIVQHIDAGLHNDQIYLVMELVDGGSLDQILAEDGVLPWRESCEVALQVCQALAHAHQRGIIHRDLKPANLFLASSGEVKVGDFGLARDNHAHRLTLQGQTVGTCRYMAPEQVSGEDHLTGAVDVYAVGCLMHLMLTGKCPFDGTTVTQVFEQHLFNPPPKLNASQLGCPPELVALVDRALAKSPVDRLTADQMAGALSALVEGRPAELPELAPQTSEQAEDNLTDRLKQKVAPAPPVPDSLVRVGMAGLILAIGALAYWLLG